MKLIEHIPNTIYTIEEFFTPEECQERITWSEKRGYEEAKINAFGKQVLMTQVRNNSRILFKNEAYAESIWQRIEPYCVREVGVSNRNWFK